MTEDLIDHFLVFISNTGLLTDDSLLTEGSKSRDEKRSHGSTRC